MAEQYSWLDASGKGYSAGQYGGEAGKLREWSRSTVADGKWLNKETIEPFSGRDQYLLDSLNQTYDECSAFSGDLQNQINVIEARADVIDVVGSYHEFVDKYSANFDPTEDPTISDKDVVKILNDETSAHSQTYYRWFSATEPTTGYWEGVGSLEPYYSNAELVPNEFGLENTDDTRNYRIIADNNRYIQLVPNGHTGTIGLTDNFIESASQCYTALTSHSASWDETSATLNGNSGKWEQAYTALTSNSASWNETSATLRDNSGKWEQSYTALTSTSGGWNNTSAWVYNNSANIVDASATLYNNSANWQATYSAVSSNSATWNETAYVPLSAQECLIGSGNKVLSPLQNNIVFIQGRDNSAHNWHSFAQGQDNIVENTNSFAQGYANHTYGENAFAQGIQNSARGSYSIAMGSNNIAFSEGAIALGANNYVHYYSLAAGGSPNRVQGNSALIYSLAVGFQNKADDESIAVGITNNASGHSIAVGTYTDADDCSFAQGWYNSASINSIAQGYGNTAYHCSFAQGQSNSATNRSLAQGLNNYANYYSMAQGQGNKAATNSLAQGYANYADRYSVAFGLNCSATEVSIAHGDKNTVSNKSIAIGDLNSAYMESIAIGAYNSASNYSQAFGNKTSAISYSMAIGKENYVSGDGSIAGGVSSNIIGNGTLVIGEKNTVSADASIIAGKNNIVNERDKSVSYFVLGNDNVAVPFANDWTYSNRTNIIAGYGNKLSGLNSVLLFGRNHTVSSDNDAHGYAYIRDSLVAGQQNTLKGHLENVTVLGQSNAFNATGAGNFDYTRDALIAGCGNTVNGSYKSSILLGGENNVEIKNGLTYNTLGNVILGEQNRFVINENSQGMLGAIIAGLGNKVSGSTITVIGQSNDAYGTYSNIFGYSNKVINSAGYINDVAVGNANIISGNMVRQNSFVFGDYNRIYDVKDSMTVGFRLSGEASAVKIGYDDKYVIIPQNGDVSGIDFVEKTNGNRLSQMMSKSTTFTATGSNFNQTFNYTGFKLSAGDGVGFVKNGNILAISAQAGIPDGTIVWEGTTAQGAVGERNLDKLCITDYAIQGAGASTRYYQYLEYSAGLAHNKFNLWPTTAATASNLTDSTIIPVIDPVSNKYKNEYTTIRQLGEALNIGNYVSAAASQSITFQSAATIPSTLTNGVYYIV